MKNQTFLKKGEMPSQKHLIKDLIASKKVVVYEKTTEMSRYRKLINHQAILIYWDCVEFDAEQSTLTLGSTYKFKFMKNI